MKASQLDLFGAEHGLSARDAPEGFVLQEDVLLEAEEAALVETLRALPLQPFQFHGYEGKRRTLSYGWTYDFARERVHAAPPAPEFLTPLRERAAAFAGLQADELEHVLLTHYPAGAGIGWHKDKAAFGDVIGVSLSAPCTLRFRLRAGSGWRRASVALPSRSAYLLRGASRDTWEHSISPHAQERYSVTFRTRRAGKG